MAKRKIKNYNPQKLIDAINKIPFPIHDKKHNLYIVIKGMARSNQTRIEHVVEYSHDLKVRDIETITKGINNYFLYKMDPVYKDTYNYYIHRKGKDKGLIKISIQINKNNRKEAWIKTIYITYNVKER